MEVENHKGMKENPYHVDKCNVEEHASGDSEDPDGSFGGLSDENPDDQTEVTHARREEVVAQRLLHRHTRVEQDRKVTW